MTNLSEEEKAKIAEEERFRAEQRRKAEDKKTSPAAWGCLTLLILGIVIAIAAGSSGGDKKDKANVPAGGGTAEADSTQEPEVIQEEPTSESLEYKLAVINAGGYVREDDTTVNRFRYLLDSMDANTKNSRQEVVDMTVKRRQILRDEYGKDMSLLEFMEEANKAVGAESKELGVDYAEIVSILVTLMG